MAEDLYAKAKEAIEALSQNTYQSPEQTLKDLDTLRSVLMAQTHLLMVQIIERDTHQSLGIVEHHKE